MRGCSRRRRASPAPAATSSSPAPTTIPARSRPCATLGFARSPRRPPAWCARWHHGRYPRHAHAAGARAPDRADAGAAEGARRDRRARPGAAELRPVPRQPAGRRAALLAVQGQPRRCSSWSPTIMGSAPGLAAHLARRPALLDAVLSPAFYRRCRRPPEMAADLAAHTGPGRRRAGHPRLWRGAGPTTGASRSASSCSSAIVDRREAGRRLLRHRRADASPRCATAVEQRFRRSRMARSAASGWPCWRWASSAAARCRRPPTST